LETLKRTKIAYIAFFISFVSVIILHLIIKPTSRNSRDESKEVIIHYIDNITSAQSKLIEIFNEEYKGKIKVELINLPLQKFSSHERKQLLTKYLRNRSDQIDLFSVDQVWISRFKNWAQPIDKYITSAEKDQIEQNALNSCIYDDSLVALPLFIDIGVMYVNEEILRKHPDFENIKKELYNSITWERFIEIGQSEVFSNQPFYIFPADNYEGLMCSFTELISNSNNLFSDNNSLLSHDIVEAAHFLVNLVQKHKISPESVTQLQENNFGSYFFENRAVFLRGWPNSFSSFYYINKELRNKNGLLCVPLPHFKNQEKRFIRGGWNLMISKYSKKKKESIEFLKFWLREDVQSFMYENNSFLPSLKIFYESDSLIAKYERIGFFKNLLEYSVFRQKNRNYTSLSDILTRYLKQAIKNEISVELALKNAQDEINSLGLIPNNASY